MRANVLWDSRLAAGSCGLGGGGPLGSQGLGGGPGGAWGWTAVSKRGGGGLNTTLAALKTSKTGPPRCPTPGQVAWSVCWAEQALCPVQDPLRPGADGEIGQGPWGGADEAAAVCGSCSGRVVRATTKLVDYPNAGRKGNIPARLLIESVSATKIAGLVLREAETFRDEVKDVVAVEVLIVLRLGEGVHYLLVEVARDGLIRPLL